jgi:H+/Cl- antiporter ClcA
MSETRLNRKSIWAVAAGVLVVVVVTTVVDVVLHVAHVFPPTDQPIDNSLALLATSYRVVISVAAAWLTARLAPDRPMKHALMLGYVGVVLGLVGLAATWNLGLGPRWYPIALVVLAIPQCWVGGRIYEARLARSDSIAEEAGTMSKPTNRHG